MTFPVATIRPPVKWYGGKYYLAGRIAAEFTNHRIYVEPFGGGASVLLNKAPAPVEVYNDLNCDLVNLFWVLRDRPDDLARLLSLTPYSRAEFISCCDVGDSDPVEQARRFFVRCRQSFSGRGETWSATTKRSRRGMADVVSGWLSAVDENLPRVIERLRRVQIENRIAVDCIRKYDDLDALIYCDPPYLHGTRSNGSLDAYQFEMADEDHRQLANVLHGCAARVVLSGYPSSLYDELYSDWRIVDFDMPNNAAGGSTKQRRCERLWINY